MQRIYLLLFVLTTFVGAFLLFMVQPMFARVVTPLLGGASNVWITLMLFFQAVLLAGYAYAHWLGNLREKRWQILIHGMVVLAALLMLPHFMEVPQQGVSLSAPVSWLLLSALLYIGLPYFLVTTSTPLLQKWFHYSGHDKAHDPYFLYVASNTGSLLALLSYPFIIEPVFRLPQQGMLWQGGFILFVVLTVLVVLHARANHEKPQPPPPEQKPGWRQKIKWIIWAFVPSSLMLSITLHITTDISPVPLLWILPLALYLLSFIVVFARWPDLLHKKAVWVMSLAVLMLVGIHFITHYFNTFTPAHPLFWLKENIVVLIVFHLLAFFLVALVFHGQIARTRPHAAYLTEFYLLMSVGGLLGSVFNVLLAPHLFNTLREFPLVLFLCALILPQVTPQRFRVWRFALVLGLMLLLYALFDFYAVYSTSKDISLLFRENLDVALQLYPHMEHNNVVEKHVLPWFMLAVFIVFVLFGRHRDGYVAIILALLAYTGVVFIKNEGALVRARSFFGTYGIYQQGPWRTLSHGVTLHGAQAIQLPEKLEPTMYYTRKGPVGEMFSHLEKSLKEAKVGIVGLGAGAMACLGKEDQVFIFYEIDPLVAHIADSSGYFSYLKDCPPRHGIVLGDARLSLHSTPNGYFMLYVVDAFNSDAVPVHLLTKEAFELYKRKLHKEGFLALHITNTHLDLEPVVARLAEATGLSGYTRNDKGKLVDGVFALPSKWVILAKNPASLMPFVDDPKWHPLKTKPGVSLWTDDFSNLFEIVKVFHK